LAASFANAFITLCDREFSRCALLDIAKAVFGLTPGPTPPSFDPATTDVAFDDQQSYRSTMKTSVRFDRR
jgi:hypothetical protein